MCVVPPRSLITFLLLHLYVHMILYSCIYVFTLFILFYLYCLCRYFVQRERFDALVGKIGDLETEKLSLLKTMRDATTPNGSSKEAAGKGGGRGGSAEALRERLKVSPFSCLETLRYVVAADTYRQTRRVTYPPPINYTFNTRGMYVHPWLDAWGALEDGGRAAREMSEIAIDCRFSVKQGRKEAMCTVLP